MSICNPIKRLNMYLSAIIDKTTNKLARCLFGPLNIK